MDIRINSNIFLGIFLQQINLPQTAAAQRAKEWRARQDPIELNSRAAQRAKEWRARQDPVELRKKEAERKRIARAKATKFIL